MWLTGRFGRRASERPASATESDRPVMRSDTLDPRAIAAARSASTANLHHALSMNADVASVVGHAHDLNERNGFGESLERAMRRR